MKPKVKLKRNVSAKRSRQNVKPKKNLSASKQRRNQSTQEKPKLSERLKRSVSARPMKKKSSLAT